MHMIEDKEDELRTPGLQWRQPKISLILKTFTSVNKKWCHWLRFDSKVPHTWGIHITLSSSRWSLLEYDLWMSDDRVILVDGRCSHSSFQAFKSSCDLSRKSMRQTSGGTAAVGRDWRMCLYCDLWLELCRGCVVGWWGRVGMAYFWKPALDEFLFKLLCLYISDPLPFRYEDSLYRTWQASVSFLIR